MKGDQKFARECYNYSINKARETLTLQGFHDIDLDVRDEEKLIQAEAAEELIAIQLEAGDLDRPVNIGAALVHSVKNDVTSSLRRNKDLFAWSHDDMPGIDPKIIAHYLCAEPSIRPLRQKRGYLPQRETELP